MRFRLLTALLVLLPVPSAAGAASAPDRGRAWAPTPVTTKRFAVKPPTDDTQRHVLEAKDGVRLYAESWIPAAKDGNQPPRQVPVVIVMTPYVKQGVVRNQELIDALVPRGYAVMQAHVRGTGEAGGCLEQTAENQIEDGVRYVELAAKVPYSSGVVGMFGKSYDAETQISTAGRGEKSRLRALKALVPVASVGGQYEYSFFDGVPYLGQAALSNAAYLGTTSAEPGETTGPVQVAEKLTCQPELFLASADQSGDMTEFWMRREYRPGVKQIDIPTFYVHGLDDFNVKPLTLAGFFDRLPAGTPKAAMLGQWAHDYPGAPTVVPEWARTDFYEATAAWFDRYLLGLPSGVEGWPVVQVQDSTGQWRATPDFPTAGGPAGQLALGPEGALGTTSPSGATTYTESEESAPGSSATFVTPPLAGDLHLVGQPVADLWVSVDVPDAHLAAKLERVPPAGGDAVPVGTFGYRSLRHLAPLVEGRFAQAAGEAPPTGTPIRVLMRFHPTDIRVPKGWRLRLTISGQADGSEPSGLAPRVTLLHDCEHTSALRFLMPGDEPLLDVRERDQKGPLGGESGFLPDSTGGGLASASVCGRAPERNEVLGPVRARPDAPAASAGRVRLALRVVKVRRRGSSVRVTLRGVARKVTAALRASRTGRVLAATRRGVTVNGTRTVSLRLRRSRQLPGRVYIALAGTDSAGRPGGVTTRVRVSRG